MAERPRIWLYRGDLVRAVDGDTADIRVSREIDFGFYQEQRWSAVVRFRLSGIDAPEMRGATRAWGTRARDFLEHALTLWPPFQVESLGAADKYGGRWDARLFARGIDPARSSDVWVDVAEHMISIGLARRYDGKGPRVPWDPAGEYPIPPESR